MANRSLEQKLAAVFLAGSPEPAALVERAAQALGRDWPWLVPLAARFAAAFGEGLRPRHRDVVRFLRADPGWFEARQRHGRRIAIEQWLGHAPQMHPARWPVPEIVTAGDLAAALGVRPSELDWLADLRSLNHSPRLDHYRYRVLQKRAGGVRLIEAPKDRLKDIQRWILREILERIPAHRAAHGFVKDRNVASFAAPHVGRAVVLRMDLEDFFPSISRPRVQALFRIAGYPESVADLLGGLCTHSTPRQIWGADHPDARMWYARPHLPQGAPASPAIANACAWRMDCRLSALAEAAGAAYTRYADDLAFSGGPEFARGVHRFAAHASVAAMDEGFQVNYRKTRVMRQGVRQHLAGLVTNSRLNVPRDDFDRLKAALTNCVRHGIESQNRDAHPCFRDHLEGRVAWVESINPGRGGKLREILQRVIWPEPR
jgi:hypothetical protein